jgi:hypothetical protein
VECTCTWEVTEFKTSLGYIVSSRAVGAMSQEPGSKKKKEKKKKKTPKPRTADVAQRQSSYMRPWIQYSTTKFF